ncbi:MAG: zf-TFIIB domain-containing protein [bacterium]
MAVEKDRKAKEDEYFAKVEFERKKKLLEDQQKQMQAAEKEKLKDLHWMRCPKCGMVMVEIDFEGVKVDKCSSCLGIYLDDGEVQMLLRQEKPGFLQRLTGVFKE